MLNRDPAAERGDAGDVGVGDRLGMVEKPMQSVERNVLVDFLVHIERTGDRLVVSGRTAPSISPATSLTSLGLTEAAWTRTIAQPSLCCGSGRFTNASCATGSPKALNCKARILVPPC